MQPLRLKEATRLKPQYAEAHFNLAVAYVALKDRKGALEEYSKLKALDAKLADNFFQRYVKK
jgi:tetratricopeptide (TPR) repeat protein